MNRNIGDISLFSQIIVASATGLGAFGGFPDPPNVFKDLIKCEAVKWVLLAVLIWQGGGGASDDHKKDVLVTIFITIMMYFGKKLLDKVYDKVK
jgi:hypothetical protein